MKKKILTVLLLMMMLIPTVNACWETPPVEEPEPEPTITTPWKWAYRFVVHSDGFRPIWSGSKYLYPEPYCVWVDDVCHIYYSFGEVI